MNINSKTFEYADDISDDWGEIEDTIDGVLSKDLNIGSMLNNSKNNNEGTSRRKKSYSITEGAKLLKKVTNLNKTHDYHHSTANLHNNNLRLFGFEEEINNKRLDTLANNKQSDLMNINQDLLNSLKKSFQGNRKSRSSQRYAKTFDNPEEFRESLNKPNKSIVKYLETSK
jgi:hypothetical protein